MMNDDYNSKKINTKKKFYAVTASCIAAITLVGLGTAGSVLKTEPDNEVTARPSASQTTANRQADAPLNYQKDDRTAAQTAAASQKEEQSSAKTVSAAESKPPEYYNLPLGTDILREYSAETPAYNEIMGDWRSHAGIDFACSYGDGVKAAAEGTVTAVYDDTVWGSVVEMNHGGGVTSKYCGLQSQTINCKSGELISAGSCIGYVGEIPCEKGDSQAHLHFEMRVNGVVSDPLEVMGFTNGSE